VAKSESSKKKVVATKTSEKRSVKTGNSSTSKYKVKRSTKSPAVELPFGKRNYQLVVLGAVLIMIGMLLMTGGSMPSPDVWDESLIYSFRRITLAPMVIVLGLVVEIFAIFSDK
jgi:hypothetical protein